MGDFNYYLLKPEHVYHVKDIPNGEALIERIRAEYSEKKWLYGEMTHALTQVLMSEIFRLTPTKRRNYAETKRGLHRYRNEIHSFALRQSNRRR